MAVAPSPPPWTLPCPWCEFSIWVYARGGPYGAGEEAADSMKQHIHEAHGKTWPEFLAKENR